MLNGQKETVTRVPICRPDPCASLSIARYTSQKHHRNLSLEGGGTLWVKDSHSPSSQMYSAWLCFVLENLSLISRGRQGNDHTGSNTGIGSQLLYPDPRWYLLTTKSTIPDADSHQ